MTAAIGWHRVGHAIGTLAWSDRNGGRLTISERLRLLSQGLADQIGAMAPWHRRRAGLDREALSGVELPNRPPDSEDAREAEALCRELSSLSLLNHCLRVYAWGALLGQRDGLAWDPELLYVAVMLHDLGLTPRHFGADPTSRCFAVDGARAAARFAAERGWGEKRRRGVAEAICMHLNVRVGLEHGPEAHLLARGAGYDVLGRGFRALPEPTREAVLERHPRLGFKREINRLMREQAGARPDSRIGLYYRFGGFGRLIARAPFAE
jgi:HD domain